MKKNIWIWQLSGFAFTSLGGTLLHFLYEWLNEASWIAPFSGVNESTWEHMKLLFWPTFIFAIVQSFFFKVKGDFWCVKLMGTLIGLALIPALYYGYNAIIGKSPDWINITIFFISAAAVYLYEGIMFNKERSCKYPILAFSVLLGIALLFIIFTFKTPELAAFRDPLTGTYGI